MYNTCLIIVCCMSMHILSYSTYIYIQFSLCLCCVFLLYFSGRGAGGAGAVEGRGCRGARDAVPYMYLQTP